MRKYSGFVIALFLLSCSPQEITRIDLTKPENQVLKIKCEKHRQVDFYLDCDIEYQEMPQMVIDFEFYQGNTFLLKGGIDPLICKEIKDEKKTTINKTTRWKFYGKLEGNFIPPGDTIFSIYPVLIKNKSKDVKIHKMDLVFVR